MREVTENDFRMPEFRNAKTEEYEFREDGKVVRKDRWLNAVHHIRNIVGPRGREFEINDVIARVEELHGRWDDAEHGEDPCHEVIDIRLDDGSVLAGCQRIAPSHYTWREGTFDIRPEDFGALAVAWQYTKEAT